MSIVPFKIYLFRKKVMCSMLILLCFVAVLMVSIKCVKFIIVGLCLCKIKRKIDDATSVG